MFVPRCLKLACLHLQEEGWCIPRFEDSTILFSDEEVDNTINIFLGLPEG